MVTISYCAWVEFLATVKYDVESRLVQIKKADWLQLGDGCEPKRLTQRDGVWRWDNRPIRLTTQQKCILDAFWGKQVVAELELATRVWGDNFKKHKYIAEKVRLLCDCFDGGIVIEYSAGNWFFSEMPCK